MVKDLFIKYNSKYHYWDNQEVKAWLATKQKGMLRFVLLEGLVKWGLVSFTIFIAILLSATEIALSDIPLIAVVWMLVACLYGCGIWLGTNWSFHRHQQTREKG